jgi:UDP-N-acetylglucosamine 2-epimerase (non-hydrolysing)
MSNPHVKLVPPPAEGRIGPAAGALEAAVLHHDGAAVVHVSGSEEDLPRVAAVAWGIEQTGAFDQVLLHVGTDESVDEAICDFDVPCAIHCVEPASGGLRQTFQAKLAQIPCVAVIVHSEGDAALAAALAATRLGIALIWIGTLHGHSVAPTTRAVVRLADLVLVHADADAKRLQPRVAPERIHVVGNPLIDVVRRYSREAAARASRRAGDESTDGHVVAIITDGEIAARLDGELAMFAARGSLSIVEAAPGVPPLVRARAAGARVIRSAGFVERLALERSAGAIVTDSRRVHEEAAALGVRCYAVGLDDAPATIASATVEAQAPSPCTIPFWDGHAGERVAAIVVANFARASFVS